MTKQIPLRGNRGKGKFAIVDDANYEQLSKLKWFYIPSKYTGYAARWEGPRGAQKLIYMHRRITDAPTESFVDHADGDGLNNTIANLRVTNQSCNMQNARPRKNSTSKYKGVYWNSCHKKWNAHIHYFGKKIYLGRYSTEQEAAIAYNKAATLYFGEFAHINQL